MAEVTVEVDGELARPERGRGTPVAGTIAAVAIAGMLALGSGILMLGSERGGASMSPSSSGTRSDAVTAVPLRLSPTTVAPTTSAATTAEPSTTTPTVEHNVLAAAERALTEWGQFAISGDRSALAAFDPDGPQYRALVTNPPDVAGDPYRVVVLEHQLLAIDPIEAKLRATTEWSRAGETTQQHVWTVTLRADGTTWRLWTVEND